MEISLAAHAQSPSVRPWRQAPLSAPHSHPSTRATNLPTNQISVQAFSIAFQDGGSARVTYTLSSTWEPPAQAPPPPKHLKVELNGNEAWVRHHGVGADVQGLTASLLDRIISSFGACAPHFPGRATPNPLPCSLPPALTPDGLEPVGWSRVLRCDRLQRVQRPQPRDHPQDEAAQHRRARPSKQPNRAA